MATMWELVELRARDDGPLAFIQQYSSEAEEVIAHTTFAEFAAMCRTSQRVLVKLGAVADGRVAFYCNPTDSRYYAYCAAAMSFGACVNLNWRTAKETLLSAVTLTESSILVCDEPYVGDARFLVRERSNVVRSLCFLSAATKLSGPAEHSLPKLEAWVATEGAGAPCWPNGGGPELGRRAEAVCLILFTSGSTSEPKPVPHTNRGMIWDATTLIGINPEPLRRQGGPGVPHPGTLCLLPNFHSIGFIHNFLYNLCAGVRTVVHVEATRRALTPDVLLAAIDATEPAHIDTVPWLLMELAERLDGEEEVVTALRQPGAISFGGAPLPIVVLEKFAKHKINLRCHFGQTEFGGAALKSSDHLPLIEVSQLRPVPGTEAYLLDTSSETAWLKSEMVKHAKPLSACVEGDTGELHILGHGGLTDGYLRAGGERKAVGVVLPTLGEGRFYGTGDLFRCVISSDGKPSLVHMCRTDDLLVHCTGEMTNPLDVEDKLLKQISTAGKASAITKLCVLGQNRATPFLAVELPAGGGSKEAAREWLVPVTETVNKDVAAYSAIRAENILLLTPPVDPGLPLSVKGAVVRPKAEAALKGKMDAVDDARAQASADARAAADAAEKEEEEDDGGGGGRDDLLQAADAAMDSLAVVHSAFRKKGQRGKGGSAEEAAQKAQAMTAVKGHLLAFLVWTVFCVHCHLDFGAGVAPLLTDAENTIAMTYTQQNWDTLLWFAYIGMPGMFTIAGCFDLLQLRTGRIEALLKRVSFVALFFVFDTTFLPVLYADLYWGLNWLGGTNTSTLPDYGFYKAYGANWYLVTLATFMFMAIAFNFVLASPAGKEPYLFGRFIMAGAAILLYFNCYGFSNPDALSNSTSNKTDYASMWEPYNENSYCPSTYFQRDNLYVGEILYSRATIGVKGSSTIGVLGSYEPFWYLIVKGMWNMCLYGIAYYVFPLVLPASYPDLWPVLDKHLAPRAKRIPFHYLRVPWSSATVNTRQAPYVLALLLISVTPIAISAALRPTWLNLQTLVFDYQRIFLHSQCAPELTNLECLDWVNTKWVYGASMWSPWLVFVDIFGILLTLWLVAGIALLMPRSPSFVSRCGEKAVFAYLLHRGSLPLLEWLIFRVSRIFPESSGWFMVSYFGLCFLWFCLLSTVPITDAIKAFPACKKAVIDYFAGGEKKKHAEATGVTKDIDV